ncbi:hypothetical protein LRY64_01395 [Candidatus Woesebacteria bacterium]|nr:hypothetical protein [Candidatus Woesebacteria bacterium]
MQLSDSVETVSGIGPKKAAELAEMEIYTVQDLLQHIPFRYEDASQVTPVADLIVGELVTLEAQVVSVRSFRTRSRVPMTQVVVVDSNGDELDLTFFHQPYVSKQLKSDEWYAFTGKVGEYHGKKKSHQPKLRTSGSSQPSTYGSRSPTVFAA